MLTEEALQSDLHNAMRGRDRQRIDVLRGLIAAIKNLKVVRGEAGINEADLLGIVRKESKKRDDIIEFAEKGNRPETVESARAEKELLEGYLPEQLQGTKLEEAIRAIANELGTTEIGPLMGELKKRHGGQYDGKEASTMIRALAG
jgi:uncharacterized protein YqeY